VATGGGLRGEKQVDPKPLLDVPAIIHLRKDVARGHMRQGANEKRAHARNYVVT
jgi:hypothetical protein